MKHFNKYALLTFSLLLLSACVTTKKKEDVKGIKLFFQNLTAKYNGYFNAKVLVDEATDKLTAQHRDNYNKILDIYPYVAVDNPMAMTPDLDKAIEKLAVVISYHRPSHWVDDSYLLIGKAQFLKHDFELAEETFQYLTDVYNPALKKLSKKERQKAADEKRKDAKRERDARAKEAKENREREAKERKEAAEEAKKQRLKDEEAKRKAKQEEVARLEKQKEEERKKAQEELENRNKNRKLTAEEAAAERKRIAEQKRKELEERNEARRKANEERRLGKDKKPEEAIAKTDDKKEKPQQITTAPTSESTDKPKDRSKQGIVKTGSNNTPLFKDEDNKKYKPKGKPDRYFLKHRPCYQEGVVWLARTHIERGNYEEAELLLGDIEKNPKTFKDVRSMATIAHAYMLLKQQNLEGAVAMLEQSLKNTRKKKQKARVAYVLAQVYQATGSADKAYAAYDKVLDYAPAYEMEFNARLNMAMTSAGTNTENVIALLNKMAKDAKNTEYRDQIFYTLAQISLKNNQTAKAIEQLKQGLAAGSQNPQQKAEIYYQLAKLQFDAEDYVESKNYFDSTQTVLSRTDSRMPEVVRYAINLTDIAQNIQTIRLQDSLLKIAAMTDKEKRTLAAAIKKARLAQAEAAQNPSDGASNNRFMVNDGAIAGISPIGGAQSTFFGYSPDLVKKGKREFDKVWGADRKLEDNWRRSNKKGGGSESSYAFDESGSGITDREVAEILKDVPKNDLDIQSAKLRIDDAMFALGTLYFDKLKNEKKCIETLEKHLVRFPETRREMEDWYYLYLAHTELKNTAKAQEYYDKLMNKYPLSTYATLLQNARNGKKNETETVEKFYLTTYELFKKGEAQKASERIATTETTYGINNPLKAKFALLNAMCIGRLQGKEEYVKALRDVTARFTGTPEEKYATEILRIIESGLQNDTQLPATEGVAQEGIFKIDDQRLHYVMIVLAQNANIEDMKIAVSDYNSTYHRLDNLSISNVIVGESPTLVLRRFKNKDEALKYTEGVTKNEKDFIKGYKYELFCATQDNYREILKEKSFENYRKFYQKYYSK